MSRAQTQPARGMRDFLPADVRRREYVIGIIKEVYERYGFEPLETPAVENIETLMGKYGEEGSQLIFKILMRGEHEKSGEADLALRYDLTVPLARVVAEYKNVLPTLFKRYQIQPVWRADRPARGSFREFYQCDIDASRSTSPIVDLTASTRAAGRIRIDPSLARGLSYYTGAIMEIAVEGIGSLGGGGRYDNLVGMFLGRDVPACGFSLGLERIIVVMTEREMFPAAVAGSPVDIVVTIWNDEARADAVKLAGELRQGGLRVDVYPEADKLGKQFKYASSRNVPFVAIVGDDERAKGEVAVKDMRTGEQKSMA